MIRIKDEGNSAVTIGLPYGTQGFKKDFLTAYQTVNLVCLLETGRLFSVTYRNKMPFLLPEDTKTLFHSKTNFIVGFSLTLTANITPSSRPFLAKHER
jgi:hypothetical protein